MKYPHRFTALTLAAGAMFVFAAGSANAASMPSSSLGDIARAGSVTTQIEDVQYRGRHLRGGPRVGRHYGGGGRRWGRGSAVGAGIAAGVVGGLLGGALLGQPGYAAPAPVYEEEPVYIAPRRGGGAVDYCMRRYRSYDPRTGTYVGYDGVERPCP